ncbi:hypothetical protein F4776DRAFT_381608 [Hypoxylon sp. NC0597]|nr:hypothetical protein F4776DRAFT_381608 [Hypoxylon sp. NC0597]
MEVGPVIGPRRLCATSRQAHGLINGKSRYPGYTPEFLSENPYLPELILQMLSTFINREASVSQHYYIITVMIHASLPLDHPFRLSLEVVFPQSCADYVAFGVLVEFGVLSMTCTGDSESAAARMSEFKKKINRRDGSQKHHTDNCSAYVPSLARSCIAANMPLSSLPINESPRRTGAYSLQALRQHL